MSVFQGELIDHPDEVLDVRWSTRCSGALAMGVVAAASDPAQRPLCFSCAGGFTDTEFIVCANLALS
ncbi:hypothetical protein [Streptomyces sp. NPDC029519]|uniref:hypothetical protein n=1 Tax=Streptomyces sp. NPDC029519 TaxID=3155364 RepID=UPI0033D0C263